MFNVYDVLIQLILNFLLASASESVYVFQILVFVFDDAKSYVYFLFDMGPIPPFTYQTSAAVMHDWTDDML